MNSKEEIINDYDKYIKFVLKDMRIGYLYDELYDLGLIGFVKGLNTFDKNKNVKISTYIYECIKNQILVGLAKLKKYNEKYNPISLDQPITVEKDLELRDVIPHYENYERNIYMDEIMYVINRRLSFLDDKQQEIFKDIYGLDGHKQLSSKELQKKYKTTKQNLYQIKSKVLNKLKHITQDYKENYLEGLYDKKDRQF